MNMTRFIIGTATITFVLMVSAGAMTLQERDALERRVELLEKRVRKLESILFTTAHLTVMEAKSELNLATERYEGSRKLHLKGFITAAQLEQDRFRVDQARRVYELARTQNDQQKIIGQIDIMEAERNLKVAEEDLAHTRRLFDRGYASGRQVDAARDIVLQLRKRLELAQSKAKAASELIELGKENSGDKPPSEDPQDKK